MRKIAFIIVDDKKRWMGGYNYKLSLLQAIDASKKNDSLQTVIITSGEYDIQDFLQLSNVEILKTTLVKKRISFLRKILTYICGRDFLLERFLIRHGVDVISHSGVLGRKSKVKSIAWIPDFQHIKLPDFFSAFERSKRNYSYAKIARESSVVILSSYDALNDFKMFAPRFQNKGRVLHFVSRPPQESRIGGTIDIKEKYDLPEKYFHLPNQFWAHKNHQVVIEAIGKLKLRGECICIVCTGAISDRRNPLYIEELKERISVLDIKGQFKLLGLIPYADMLALMVNSMAVINPSLFEGWSTSVEEAKSLGVPLLLSDIAVHREQSPQCCEYFPPKNADALANLLLKFRNSACGRMAPADNFYEKQLAFGREYIDIVNQVIADLR